MDKPIAGPSYYGGYCRGARLTPESGGRRLRARGRRGWATPAGPAQSREAPWTDERGVPECR
jgi:hypothetical protein